MARYKIINPEAYAGMQVVQVPDQEVLLSETMLKFVELWRQYDPPMAADYDVQELEFDPAKIAAEAFTTARLSMLTRINHAARAITLAFAVGTDLDGVASRYPGGVPRVSSEIILSSDTPLVRMRKDARYRERIWLSPNALGIGATEEGYRFQALTALPEAKDVSLKVIRRPGEVIGLITAMMDRPDPKPTRADILDLKNALDTESTKGMSDVLNYAGPGIIDTRYDVDYWLYPWADKDIADKAIKDALAARIVELRFLGSDHARIDLGKQLAQFGVHSGHMKNFPGATEVIEADDTQFINATLGDVQYRGRKS